MIYLRNIYIAIALFFSYVGNAFSILNCPEVKFRALSEGFYIKTSPPFRVFYNPVKVSTNKVSDILQQLHAANYYYSNNLGLLMPLKTFRYESASYIDVHLTDTIKGNGRAFDEVVLVNASRLKSKACSIVMQINIKVEPTKNLTPAHELFHLYQYSNSMFKSSWYLEGMARWIETAFSGTLYEFDQERLMCNKYVNKTYAAGKYWSWLSAFHKYENIYLTEEQAALKYSNGQKIFGSRVFNNGAAVLDYFTTLNKLSAIVSGKQGIEEYKWPESLQRSSFFDQEICDSIQGKSVLP